MESKLFNRLWDSVLNNPNIAIHRNIVCKLLKNDVILSLIGLLLNIYFTANDATKGIIMKVRMLFARLTNSIVFELEKNSSRYTGNKINCSTKFIGSMDKLSGTFPLLIFVNIKYQSVHGVNISITNPMNRSMWAFKNRFPKK